MEELHNNYLKIIDSAAFKKVVGPLHSRLYETKRAEYTAVTDHEAAKAGLLLDESFRHRIYITI